MHEGAIHYWTDPIDRHWVLCVFFAMTCSAAGNIPVHASLHTHGGWLKDWIQDGEFYPSWDEGCLECWSSLPSFSPERWYLSHSHQGCATEILCVHFREGTVDDSVLSVAMGYSLWRDSREGDSSCRQHILWPLVFNPTCWGLCLGTYLPMYTQAYMLPSGNMWSLY